MSEHGNENPMVRPILADLHNLAAEIGEAAADELTVGAARLRGWDVELCRIAACVETATRKQGMESDDG